MQEAADTRSWLDRRFSRREDGYYFAHQPIYGFGSADSETGHVQRLARTLNLLLALSRLEFRTFLDVGAGEGYLTMLIHRILAADGVALELSLETCRRARELFGLPTVVADAHELPFPDDSFDLVLASEVLEHVERPWQVAVELARVARRYIVVTTEEFCRDSEEQALKLRLRDFDKSHTERNFFTAEDIRSMLGDGVELQPQFANHLPREESAMSLGAARRLIGRIAKVEQFTAHTRGVIAVARLQDAPLSTAPRLEQGAVMDLLLSPLVSSPTAIPEVDAARRSADLPQPVCQAAGCAAHGKAEAECPHIIRHPDGIFEYSPPSLGVLDAPPWAHKLSMKNTAEGEERRELSRLMRKRETQALLKAPEPLFTKLAWLAGRGWKRFSRLLSLKS